MASIHRLFSVLFISIVTLAVATGCSTSPDTVEDQQRIDETGAEDLLQTSDVIVAGRIAPDELSSLTPLFQRVAQTIDEPEVREFADVSPDPIGHLESMHDMPNDLPALAEDQASYVILSHLGNLDFLQAARLGLPTMPQEWPAYFNVRLLLPSGEPDALSEQLEPWIDELIADAAIGAAEVHEGTGFVRLELAVNNRGVSAPDGIDAEQWLAELQLDNLRPPTTAEFHPTPAYNAFVDSDAPFGMWAPIDSLSRLGAFELLELFAADHQQIGPAGQPQHFLEGVSRIAAASVVDDPVSAEIADLAVLVSARDDGALLIDSYATRTEQGAELYEAMSGSVSLPGFSIEQPFIDVAAQADMEAIGNTARQPYWSNFETDADVLEADLGARQTVDNSPLPFSDDPAALPLLTMAAQYPWTSAKTASETFGDLVPLPRALTLQTFQPEGMTGLPFGGGLVAVFTDTSEHRMAIEQLLGMADNALHGNFDAELFGRDDGLLEVHVALGAELQDVVGDSDAPRDISNAEVSFDLGAVQGLAQMIPGSDAMELFDRLHLRSDGDESYQTLRITVGSDEAVAAEPVDSELDAIPMPEQRCRTLIAAASIEHLSDLRADATGHVDRWADAVAERADQCLEPNHPAASVVEQRIELARELAGDIP